MPRTGGPTFRSEVVKARKASPSLTAAAKVYENGPGAQSINKAGRRTRSIEYQNDLWDFYDTVPEFRFACSWVGNQMSKVKIVVRYKGKPTTNQEALDAEASLFGGPEGQAEMMRLLGVNFTVCGEGYVVGKPDPKTHQDDWAVIASVEVSKNGETILVEQEELPDEAVAIRMWRVHPRRSSEADSPSRALMPVLAEVVMLTQVVAAQGSSRLTSSGILWIPQEIELPAMPVTEEDSTGENPDETSMQLNAAGAVTQRLVRIASIAIGDRSSASANVPFVIAAPGEHLEKIQKTEFWSGFDEHAKDLRDEAIRRIGVGMDMPPEVLTGTGEINHWGAWSVEEAAIKSHTEPLAEIIVNALTTGYLQPYLEDMGVEDWQNYTFEADTSELRLRPNRSKEALELWDRGAISIETLLRENGFDPDTDRPEEAERIMFFLMKVAEKTSATPAQLAEALEQLGVKGMPSGDDEARGPLETRSLEEHPSQDIPDEEESEAGVPRGLNAAAHLPVIIDPLVLACEAHVHRALERAGNRLKNKIGRNFGGAAADLYLSVPEMDYAECEGLLEDAWTALDRFEYPGIRAAHLENALHQYTLFLLRAQKPMTRASLARHLMLELGDQAA